MQRQRFKMLHSRYEHRAGSIVYKAAVVDYGCANMDSRSTGVDHVSVTFDPEGGYPVFTIPVSSLEAIEDQKNNQLTKYPPS